MWSLLLYFHLRPSYNTGWNKHDVWSASNFSSWLRGFPVFHSLTPTGRNSVLPTAIHLQNHSFPVCMYGHIRIIILYPCSKYLYQRISVLMCNAILLLLFLLHSFLKLLMSVPILHLLHWLHLSYRFPLIPEIQLNIFLKIANQQREGGKDERKRW